MHRLRPLALLSLVALLSGLLLAACSAGGAAPSLEDEGGPTRGDVSPAPQAPAKDDGEEFGQPAPDAPLIIYSGSLEIEVSELRPAIDQADQAVKSLGGHVADSTISDWSDRQTATVTYRIPAERWEEALAALRGMGTRLLSESTSSQDVTAQVVDLDARLDNLRATESALQAIMDRATSIPDVLEVQRELTRVRGDIESMTAQRDVLAERAALATLEVTFEVPVPESSRVSEGWDLGRELDNAVAALVRVGQGLASLAIWLVIVGLPILVPLLIVIYVAIRLRRRWVANHPAPVAAASAGGPGVPPPGPWNQED